MIQMSANNRTKGVLFFLTLIYLYKIIKQTLTRRCWGEGKVARAVGVEAQT